MTRTIEQEIQYHYGMVDAYKDLEKNHTNEALKKACRDYAEDYLQIAKWLEELIILREALDMAGDDLPYEVSKFLKEAYENG